MTTITTGTAALSLFLVSVVFYSRRKRQKARNPPGPTPLPLLGNLLDFPIHYAWFTYDKWKKIYGDVIYMNVFGKDIVVVNSLRACNDLFEKRSAKYSSRPRMPMLGELMGWESSFALMPYSPRWRRHRRLFHQHFAENPSMDHHSTLEQKTYSFVHKVYKSPQDLFGHLRFLFGDITFEAMYGLKLSGPSDPLLKAAEEAVHSGTIAGVPGRFWVDAFPILKYVPAWFPGAYFKRQAEVWRKIGEASRMVPFMRVKDMMDKGIARPCAITSMLDNEKDSEQSEPLEDTVVDCAATAYLAGADTMTAILQAFFMAMANNPQVQQAAQAQLDKVLGGSRLPTFHDTRDLPFVHAIIKEVLRWHSPAPLAIPHELTEDDEYNGYVLRKGTLVMGNIWSILHDPEIYADPLKFNPWRWTEDTPEGMKLGAAIPDPDIAVFGYGRRICPGRRFGTDALFIVIATVLTCYDIRPLDSKGQPAERVEEAFSSALLCVPKPFKVAVTPRSDKAGQLLRDIGL